MTGKHRAHRSTCPISAALEIVGDRWSLLIVRDLLFGGPLTYKDLASAAEGIATNVLADRLRGLEAAGIITADRHPDDGRRIVYRLTAKGIDLTPVVMSLSTWGTRHEEGEPPPGILPAWRKDPRGFVAALRRRHSTTA